MDKRYFQYVFVVLTYKNYIDLIDLLNSINLKINNYKVIVVNSFFDNLTAEKIRSIALKYNCDFFNIPNKGYSYGNNSGIDYAQKKYNFDYIICSNPDIIIENFDNKILPSDSSDIYCGRIIARNNRNQNPMRVIRSKLYEKGICLGYVKNRKILLFFSIGLNKLYSVIFSVYTKTIRKSMYKIYQPHGSFIIFSRRSLEKIGILFDENMFLFSEEGVVAIKAKKNDINILYSPDILCRHKEDSSMNLWNGDINLECRKSFLYFYETYCKND